MWHAGVNRIDVQFRPFAFCAGLHPGRFHSDLRRFRPKVPFANIPAMSTRLPDSFRLAGSRRMDLCAPDVPFPAPLLRGRISTPVPRRLVGWQNGLDHRLSAFGPASFRSRAAADPHPGAVGGRAGGFTRRRRSLQLALALWSGSGPLGSDRCAGRQAARFPAARWFFHV